MKKDKDAAHMTRSEAKRRKVVAASDYTKRGEESVEDMDSDTDFDLDDELKVLKSKYYFTLNKQSQKSNVYKGVLVVSEEVCYNFPFA